MNDIFIYNDYFFYLESILRRKQFNLNTDKYKIYEYLYVNIDTINDIYSLNKKFFITDIYEYKIIKVLKKI